MQDELIDRIYEAALAPDLWPEVLDAVASLADAKGGLLFSARKTLDWTASEPVREVFQAYVDEGWFARCSRRVCLMKAQSPSFLTERDFWSDDQLDADPIYRDFFRPRGLGWSAGTGLSTPLGDSIVFSLERALERGPFELHFIDRLNGLRPHLARSAMISARLNLQRAEGASQALAAMGMPAVLLDDRARLMSGDLGMLSGAAALGAGDRLILTDRTADARLAEALKSVDTPGASAGMSLPVRDGAGRASGVLHVLPLRRSARDLFGRAYILLVLTPLDASRAPAPALLSALFDLTPAEARVASGLARAESLDRIAASGGVSLNTVRTQVRRVLEKTGCARQVEVAALFAGLGRDPN